MINSTEIDNLKNSNVFTTLENDTNVNKFSGSIESFNTESQTVLKGQTWDHVREKLNEYNNALQASKNCGNDLLNTVNEIVDGYKHIISPYDYLNISEIDAIQNSISAAKTHIANLEGQLNSNVLKLVIVDDKETYVSVPLYEGDGGRYNSIKNQIAATKDELTQLEIKFGKLQELKTFIEKSKVKLRKAMQNVTEYQQMVDGLVVSSTYIYK